MAEKDARRPGLHRAFSSLFMKVIHNENRMTNRKKMTVEELAFKNRKMATRVCKLQDIDDEDFDDEELMDQIDDLDENDLTEN